MYIPNGVDLEVFGAPGDRGPHDGVARREPVMREISRMRESGRFVLGYMGTFGRVNGVDVLVRAAEIAEERAPGRVGLLLVGDGPERESVERLARSVPAVAVRAAVAKQHVPEILRALDATVVHATATPVYRYGISFNKLFEYMAAGRPVVFACESTYDPVADAGAGVTIPPNDPERIAEAFLGWPPRRPRPGPRWARPAGRSSHEITISLTLGWHSPRLSRARSKLLLRAAGAIADPACRRGA